MLTSLVYSVESWTGEVSVIQRGVRKMMINDQHYVMCVLYNIILDTHE